MTTLTSTDLTRRARSRSRGIVRAAFERNVDGRERKGRRHAMTCAVLGFDRLDLSEIERRSLFEFAAPERH